MSIHLLLFYIAISFFIYPSHKGSNAVLNYCQPMKLRIGKVYSLAKHIIPVLYIGFAQIRSCIAFFIAFLFHMSALMFLVYYFFNRDFNKRLIVVVLLLAIVIGQSSIPSYLFVQFSGLLGETAASKAEMYSTRPLSATANSFIGLVRRLLFFFVFLFSYDKIVKKFPIYKMLFNGWTLGLLIYFMFASSFVILVGRGGFYFTIMECFLLASLLFLFKGKHRVFLFAALSVYSFFILYQSISEYPHLFLPYKGLFINTSFERTWEIF